MRRVTTLTLTLCLLSIPSFIAAWLIEHLTNPSDSSFAFGAGPLFFAMSILLLTVAFSLEIERIHDFEEIFGFDPRPNKRELVQDPQYVVSTVIEDRRQRAQELFQEEGKLLGRPINCKGARYQTYDDAFQALFNRKTKAKDAFWKARNNARMWGFAVPNSINESAVPQPIAA